MRRRAALAIGVIGVLILALPALASANWTHKGKGELKENASVTLSGELTLSTSAGNVTCPTSIGTTLTASSSAGHVNSFTVSEPSKCDLSGSLGTICGTNGLTKVEKTGTWALAADETDITLSSIDVHYTLAGCLISTFRLKGSATLSLDKTTAIGKATFSGTQTLDNSLGEESGSGELKGTLSASPAGTYGVKTGATVETKWTDKNKQLSKDSQLTLSGTFSFSGSKGSVSCPAVIKLQLESSTVEEEEPEGQTESFTVAKPSECDVSGTLGTLCGTNSVSSVEQTGTASLSATEEEFTINGLVLDYKFTSCEVTGLRVEGNPTVSVNIPSAIGSVTFSAGALEIFNEKGETTSTASAGGSASASPSGTYQLASIPGFWYTDPGHVKMGGEAEAHTFNGGGELSSTKGPLTSGPCPVTAHGELWNSATMGEGLITGFTIGATHASPCPTSFSAIGCNLAAASPTNLPWKITLTKSAIVDIEGAAFHNIYTGCGPIGIPDNAPVSFPAGTVTGVVEGEEIFFENAGDLEFAGEPVTINGFVVTPNVTAG